MVAFHLITRCIGTIISDGSTPFLTAGGEYGSALTIASSSLNPEMAPSAENRYTGPTDIISADVMDKIVKFSEDVSNEVATNMIIGSALTCFAVQHGTDLAALIPKMTFIIPDIWLWLCGAAIWMAGFMLTTCIFHSFIDFLFRLGFAVFYW